MKQKPFLFVAFCLLSVASCKAPKDEVTNYPISDAVKSYYNYQAGSYWIFKDSLSGEQDSFVVTNYAFKPSVPASYQSSFDNIDISIADYRLSGQLDTTNWRLNLTKNQADLYFNVKGKIELGYYIGTMPMTTLPIGSVVAVCGDSVYTSTILHPQINLNGNMIDSVYAIGIRHHKDSCYSIGRNDQIYINRNQGLVKLQLNNYVNRNWELVRWKIIR